MTCHDLHTCMGIQIRTHAHACPPPPTPFHVCMFLLFSLSLSFIHSLVQYSLSCPLSLRPLCKREWSGRQTGTCMHTVTHLLTLSVSLSLSHPLCLTLSVSPSLSHSLCLTLSVSLSLSHSLCLSLSLSPLFLLLCVCVCMFLSFVHSHTYSTPSHADFRSDLNANMSG